MIWDDIYYPNILHLKDGKYMRYIAVFKSLSYASRAKNEFVYAKRPETIKTPKSVVGGCSYSLVFLPDQLDSMKKIVERHAKGFIGIYKETEINLFEAIL